MWSDQMSVLDRIRDALSFVSPDNRETWVKMGMAVKSEVSESGFDLWNEWSQSATSYNARDARDVWKSIRANGKVTAGTLFHEARANGWRDVGASRKPTLEEIADGQRVAAERAAKDEADIACQRAETNAKAAAILKAATAANPDQPYLVRKAVAPVSTMREIDADAAATILGYAPKSGGKVLSGRLLVVPVKQGDRLSTLELIDGDGLKAALVGRGTKGGGYWATERLPECDGLSLLIGEGVATVLSAREATGYPGIAALSAGNLPAVAKAIRARYPSAKIVILADLMKATGEPDRHARETAQIVGGLLAIPDFGETRPDGATDFNDLSRRSGTDAVRRCIDGAKRVVAPDNLPRAILTCAANIKPEAVTWLWPGWLAAGKLAILAGAPGTGKTTLALSFAATLTSGGAWPDGSRAEVGEALIWSAEDGIADTLVPRLAAMGADRSRIHFIEGALDDDGRKRPFDPATDVPQLAAAIKNNDQPPRLLVVDPIVSAVAGDAHKSNETRRALQPLVDLAAQYGIAVIGISHFSKGTAGRDTTERVTGSVAFGALARIVLATAKMPDDQGGGRVVVRAKSNLGPDNGGFRYDLRQVEVAGSALTASAVLWGEAVEGNARDILAEAEARDDDGQKTATDEAVDFLRGQLRDGPMKAADVKREGTAAGISDPTLRLARQRLGIRPEKRGYSGGWWWRLPSEGALGLEDAHPFETSPSRETAPSTGSLVDYEAF
ncbi:MAG TPA: AAA family ATPase [Steroidobacteraceae bacterium]|nr:AAA family ATPase [Steroidobacteraceae bacterium]